MDLDGRISPDQRVRFNIDKAFTVWRVPDSVGIGEMSEEERALLDRGGREKFGTVFYLREEAKDE